jgi:hypothetical protein
MRFDVCHDNKGILKGILGLALSFLETASAPAKRGRRFRQAFCFQDSDFDE